jgi:hypothetical protein
MTDARLTRVQELIANRPDLFARQATVVTTWRTVRYRRLGPYFSLRYRDGHRQCSVYLGASTELADVVRGMIAAAQHTRREQIALHRMRAAVKASLREHMRGVRCQLEQFGLTLKGFEVRGWRSLNSATGAKDELTAMHQETCV